MDNFKLKIASRRSKLAMVQTLWVKDQLEKNIPNLEVSVEAMATQGDKILDVAHLQINSEVNSIPTLSIILRSKASKSCNFSQ